MNKSIKTIQNPYIDMVKGYYSNGLHCGIKKSGKLDLGIVMSETPAKTYALFTTNKFKGAPLIVTQKHLKNNRTQLLVVNSGIANTCTGSEGIKNSEKKCEHSAKVFGIKKDDVIPMSTGIIGKQLPIKNILEGISKLKNKSDDNNMIKFPISIMTTDTYPKIFGVNVSHKNKEYKIVGTVKGAGMINPNMATMLAFIFTDVDIDDDLLKKAFKDSINKSFNSISVDGDTSTNDTAIIFANGQANNASINNAKTEEYKIFCEALDCVTIKLAKDVIKDGEGATKLVEITVKNAQTLKDAQNICRSVSNSNLVKTAFFGEDPNWGRIICATGYSESNFDPQKLDLYLGNIKIFFHGNPLKFSEEKAKKVLQNNEIKVIINLNSGTKTWTAWTSDLTYDYIKINASYRT